MDEDRLKIYQDEVSNFKFNYERIYKEMKMISEQLQKLKGKTSVIFFDETMISIVAELEKIGRIMDNSLDELNEVYNNTIFYDHGEF